MAYLRLQWNLPPPSIRANTFLARPLFSTPSVCTLRMTTKQNLQEKVNNSVNTSSIKYIFKYFIQKFKTNYSKFQNRKQRIERKDNGDSTVTLKIIPKVSENLGEGLTFIMAGKKPNDIPSFLKYFWEDKQKFVKCSSRDIRYQ